MLYLYVYMYIYNIFAEVEYYLLHQRLHRGHVDDLKEGHEGIVRRVNPIYIHILGKKGCGWVRVRGEGVNRDKPVTLTPSPKHRKPRAPRVNPKGEMGWVRVRGEGVGP